jgi:hypothetical protein
LGQEDDLVERARSAHGWAVEQLKTGAKDLRALRQPERSLTRTHNIRDYVLLDREYRARGKVHLGIVVSDQVPFRELLRRSLRWLGRKPPADARNQIVWLHDFK